MLNGSSCFDIPWSLRLAVFCHHTRVSSALSQQTKGLEKPNPDEFDQCFIFVGFDSKGEFFDGMSLLIPAGVFPLFLNPCKIKNSEPHSPHFIMQCALGARWALQ